MDGLTQAFESIRATQWLYGVACVVLLVFAGLIFRTLWQDRSRGLRWAALVFIIGMLLRLGWIALTQPDPVSDYEVYWRSATTITQGNPVFDNAEKHPGIILLLHYGQLLFGLGYWAGWAGNLLFSAIILGAVYAIARRAFGENGGLLALLLAAVHPQLVTFSALLASELPALAFMMTITWAVLNEEKFRAKWPLYWLGLGILLYGAVLTRSTYLLFIGLTPLFLLVLRRENLKLAARQYAVMALTAAMLIGTWSYHQFLITGSPKLFWGSELWLYSTAQYEHGGRFVQPAPGQAVWPKMEKDWLSGTQEGRRRGLLILGDEAKKMLMADPVKYLWFGFVRMKNILWTTAEAGIRSCQEGSRHLQSLPEKSVTRFAEASKQFNRVLLLLSLTGLFGFFRRQRETREALFLMGSYLVCWLGFHYLMAIASDRWALQIAPYVVILAGGGLSMMMRRIAEIIGARLGRKFTAMQGGN